MRDDCTFVVSAIAGGGAMRTDAGLSWMQDLSFNHRRDRFGCFCVALSYSRRRLPLSSDQWRTMARRLKPVPAHRHGLSVSMAVTRR